MKVKNQLSDLLGSNIVIGILLSKNVVWRVINKIKVELIFIEKIVVSFKEVYVLNEIVEVDIIIELFDKEVDEIVVLVDEVIENVERYV